jgi:hypothetical protein
MFISGDEGAKKLQVENFIFFIFFWISDVICA